MRLRSLFALHVEQPSTGLAEENLSLADLHDHLGRKADVARTARRSVDFGQGGGSISLRQTAVLDDHIFGKAGFGIDDRLLKFGELRLKPRLGGADFSRHAGFVGFGPRDFFLEFFDGVLMLVALLLVLLAANNPLQAFLGVAVVIVGIPAFRLVRGQKKAGLPTHVNKTRAEAARALE